MKAMRTWARQRKARRAYANMWRRILPSGYNSRRCARPGSKVSIGYNLSSIMHIHSLIIDDVLSELATLGAATENKTVEQDGIEIMRMDDKIQTDNHLSAAAGR